MDLKERKHFASKKEDNFSQTRKYLALVKFTMRQFDVF